MYAKFTLPYGSKSSNSKMHVDKEIFTTYKEQV